MGCSGCRPVNGQCSAFDGSDFDQNLTDAVKKHTTEICTELKSKSLDEYDKWGKDPLPIKRLQYLEQNLFPMKAPAVSKRPACHKTFQGQAQRRDFEK